MSRRVIAALAAGFLVFGGAVIVTPQLASATPLETTEGEVAQDPAPQEQEAPAEADPAPATPSDPAPSTPAAPEQPADPTPFAAPAGTEDYSITNLILEGTGGLATGTASPGQEYLSGLIISALWDASINVRIPFFSGSGADLVDYSKYLEFAVDTPDGYLSADGEKFNFELVEVKGLKYIQLVNPHFARSEGAAAEEYDFKLRVKPGVVPNGTSFTLVPSVYTDNTFATQIQLQEGVVKSLKFSAKATPNTWNTNSASTIYSKPSLLEEGGVNKALDPFYFTQRVTPADTTGAGKVWADTVTRSYTILLPGLIDPGSGLKITGLSGAVGVAPASLTESAIPASAVSYDETTREITVTATYTQPAEGRGGEIPSQQYGIKIEGLHIGAVPLGTTQTVKVTSTTSVSVIGDPTPIATNPASLSASVGLTHGELPVPGKYEDRVRIYKRIAQICDDGVGLDQKCTTSHTQPGNGWTATHEIYGFDNANGAPLKDFYFVERVATNDKFSPSAVTTGEYLNPGGSTSYTIKYTTDATVEPVSKVPGSGYYDYKNSGINWVTLATRSITDPAESLNLPAGVTAVMWDFGTVGGVSIDDKVGMPDRANSFKVTSDPAIIQSFTTDITVTYGAVTTYTDLHYVDQAYEDYVTTPDARFRWHDTNLRQRFANHNFSQTKPVKKFDGCEHPGWPTLIDTCFPSDIAKYTVTIANKGDAGPVDEVGSGAAPELEIVSPKIYDTLDEYHKASTLVVESAAITGPDARTLDPSEYVVTRTGQDFTVSFPGLHILFRQSLVIKYSAQLEDEAFFIAANPENAEGLDEGVNARNWLTGVSITPEGGGGGEMGLGGGGGGFTDPDREPFEPPKDTETETTAPSRRTVPSTKTELAVWNEASGSFQTGTGRYVEEYKPTTYRLSGTNLDTTVRTKDIRADDFTLRAILPGDETMRLLSTAPENIKAYKTVNGVDTPIEVEAVRDILNAKHEVLLNFPDTELNVGEAVSVEFQAQAEFLGAYYHSGVNYTHAGVTGLFDIDVTSQPHFSTTGSRSYRSIFTNVNTAQGLAVMTNPFTSEKYLQQKLTWASDNFFYGEEIIGTQTTSSFQAQGPHPAGVEVPVPAVGVTYSATQTFNEVKSVRVLDAAGNELLAGSALKWRVIRPGAQNVAESATETVVVEVRHNGNIVKLNNGEKLEVVFSATIKPWRITGNTATVISDLDTRAATMASSNFVFVSEEDPASIKPLTTVSPNWAMDSTNFDENLDTQRLFRTEPVNTPLLRKPYTAHGIAIATDTGALEFTGGQANRWVATVSNGGTKDLDSYYVVAAMPKEFTYDATVTTSDTNPEPWENYAPIAQLSTAGQNLLVWEFGGDTGYATGDKGGAKIQFGMRSEHGVRAYEPEVYLIPNDEVNEAVRQAEGAPGRAVSRARVPFMAQLESKLGEDLSARTIIRNSLVTNSSGVLQLVYGGAKPSLPEADADDVLSYTFSMGSRGAQHFGNIEVMDVFPSVGDQFVSNPTKRESTVAITSTGQIKVRECNLTATSCTDLDDSDYTAYSSKMSFANKSVGHTRSHWDLSRLTSDYGFSEGLVEGATAALVVMDPAFHVEPSHQLQIEFFAKTPSVDQLVGYYGDVLQQQNRFELDSLIGANSIASLQDYGPTSMLGTEMAAIETPLGVTEVTLNTVGQRVWYDHLGTGVQGVDALGAFVEPGIAKAKVTLQSVADPALRYEAETDAEGSYQFLAAKDGEYVIQVETPAVVNGVLRTFSGMDQAAGASGSAASGSGSSRAAGDPTDPEFLRLRSEIVSAEVVGDTLVGKTAPFQVTRGLVNNIMYAGVTPADPSVAYKLNPVVDPPRVLVHTKSTITATAEDQYGVLIEVPDETLRITAGLEKGDKADGNIVTFGGIVGTRTITVEADVRGVTLSGTVQVEVYELDSTDKPEPTEKAGKPATPAVDPHELSLTGGQITGIVVGGVVILALGALAIILSVVRKRRREE